MKPNETFEEEKNGSSGYTKILDEVSESTTTVNSTF
jgi:hypothetical protein